MHSDIAHRQCQPCATAALDVSWTPWQPWALVSILVFVIAHRFALQDAMTYGDLIRASFDLYRFDLYRALRWPLPTQIGHEEKEGEALTEFVLRGTVGKLRLFEHSVKQ